jgi:hypothetical protein
MEHCKSASKAMECLDKEFPSKFLLTVNKCYHIWLKECKISINRSKVNDLIIDFSSTVSQVIFGTFHMDLPPTFKMIAPEESSAPGKGGKHPKLEGDNKQNKKKGKKDNTSHKLIKKEHPHTKQCMLMNKTWATNFANMHIDKPPQWNKKRRCCPH